MKLRAVKFSDAQWAAIKQAAKREGVSASEFIRRAVAAQVAIEPSQQWGGKR
jgi:hypothetical protein